MRRFINRWVLALICAGTLSATALLHAQGYSFTFSGTDTRTASTTITAATTSAAYDALKALVTINPATTFSAGTNRLSAARGEIDVAAGKTITDGFFYGNSGKVVWTTGTFNQSSAGRITGLIGQVDMGTMTYTAGQISGVWADLQGGSVTNTGGEMYPLRVTNSSGATASGLAFMYGAAGTLITAAADGGTATWFGDASGTSAGQCAQTGGVVFTKVLKVNIMSTDYWIGLCTAP